MTDMEISVRFRWETGVYGIINTFGQILVNDVLNKIFGNCCFFSHGILLRF